MGRISKTQWLKAALEALAAEGISGVRVDVLAKRLGISKSGFYWHFKSREELDASLLDYWAHQTTGALVSDPEIGALPPRGRLTRIAEAIVKSDLARYEAAISQWALRNKAVARVTRKVNRKRLEFVRTAFEELGFHGDDLEMRARMFTCYVTWEGPMFREMTRKRRRELIGKRIELLTSE